MMTTSLYTVGLHYVMWRPLPGILVRSNTRLLNTVSYAALRFSRQDLLVDFSPTRALFPRKCVCLQSLETFNESFFTRRCLLWRNVRLGLLPIELYELLTCFGE